MLASLFARLQPTQISLIMRLQVSSCFSQLLNLHNLSEEISNAQLERAVRIGEVGAMCG